ncbi:hypothetical protein HV824_01710 [Myxococcus sp. AM009]|uniref:hypothetical protein n=1 Tax=unclassified Myxococcus TaxID=2648731 RepID=UPI0015954D9E|nr:MULTISPECIES: hypothetical protein [unclassified Myxococcus]NVI96842.1 hypothetical protein [Myxococcus sp. AM009]NVJ15723.1 hypothetical protein [Myxococcus sp. AM010]
MNRINSLNGPRIQPPTTQASSRAASTGFGALVNPMAPANRPGDPLMVSGGAVVASALASVGGSPNNGMLNSYLSAVGRGPISEDGSRAPVSQAPAGSEQAQQEQVLMELAEMSAATLSNSILHMGNKMKVDLDRE